jgi:(R,R)-butanediol dehydrogenase/meso-butanediol dehydrogenase/diacetyl reductase/L-iditol 2-dehydrogenase
MKALIVKDFGQLEIQDVTAPEPGPDEIQVKIAYSGICGTDPIIVEGKTFGRMLPIEGAIGWPRKPAPVTEDARVMGLPMRDGLKIIGHEASGTISKMGKECKAGFKIGQRVALDFRCTCGVCYFCMNGMPNFCERLAPLSGVMAEYAVFKEKMIYPIPDDMPMDIGAFLEPVSIAVSVLDKAHMKTGDSVIITGGGTIGQLVLQMAIRSGASKILVSEPIAEKRKLAKQLGADVVVDPIHEDLLAISNKFTDGRGFSIGFETSGRASIARQLILLAKIGGTVVWVATYPPNMDLGVPIFYMHIREITVHDVMPTMESFPRALQMLPKLDLKPLITVYPFKDAIKAFEAHNQGKAVKIMLQM